MGDGAAIGNERDRGVRRVERPRGREGDEPPMTASDPATREILASYRAVPYDSRPCANSTPARIATIARLMGLGAPEPSTARVLEIACGDGGNLLPMAVRAPQGRFVGIDLASDAIAVARAMAGDLGLPNVELIDGDLRDLPAEAGSFDYIVAHGFYSWVPAAVRTALFDTLRARLAPAGIAFVSHNVLPGCALRGVTWSLLRPHVAGIADPAAKVAEIRAMAGRIADAMANQPGLAAGLAQEFRDVAARETFALMHDDFAPVNHPVFLRDLAAEASGRGLAWLADADPYRHPAPAYGEAMNAWLASAERMEREHVIDHLRMRRFRESLFVHEGRDLGHPLAAERLALMHVAASNTTVERHDARTPAPSPGDRSPSAIQRRLIARLVACHPSSEPVEDLAAWIAAESGPGTALAARGQAARLLLSACLMQVLVPFAWPVDIPRSAGERPRAFAPSRWQASRHQWVVNLRHESVRLDDPVQRRLLPLLDGTRTRADLAAALSAGASGSPMSTVAVDGHLAHFARIGVIEA